MGEGERGVDNLPIGGFNKNKNKLQDISKTSSETSLLHLLKNELAALTMEINFLVCN